MKRIDKQPWWPELVELKDELSLRELSERFGASPAAIANALKRNGIKRRSAPAGPRKARKPDDQYLVMIGSGMYAGSALNV